MKIKRRTYYQRKMTRKRFIRAYRLLVRNHCVSVDFAKYWIRRGCQTFNDKFSEYLEKELLELKARLAEFSKQYPPKHDIWRNFRVNDR